MSRVHQKPPACKWSLGAQERRRRELGEPVPANPGQVRASRKQHRRKASRREEQLDEISRGQTEQVSRAADPTHAPRAGRARIERERQTEHASMEVVGLNRLADSALVRVRVAGSMRRLAETLGLRGGGARDFRFESFLSSVGETL